MSIEFIIGIGIWVAIFLVWYARNYPEKLKNIFPVQSLKVKWPRRKKENVVRMKPRSPRGKDFKTLVETVEKTCAHDKFMASDAASMVEAVKQLVEIEAASGQIWEAYALDSLETAEIVCDECRIPVDKIVKKTGVRIQCEKCGKWLALKNSKVTVIDPHRPDLEDWEKYH
jgi:predicted SprT family Zn-dependent metalloprotease